MSLLATPLRLSRPVTLAPLVTGLGLVPLGLLLVVEALLSLRWRIGHDTALLHFAASRIEWGRRVPYRDLFETSMPGTFYFHRLVLRVAGPGDLAFAAVNLLWLALLLGLTWLVMRHFGRLVAATALILFGLAYFQGGRPLMLQRDALLLLPIVAALAVAFGGWGSVPARALTIGVLVGVASSIKPHAALALLPFLGYEGYRAGLWARGSRRRSIVPALGMAGGLLLPWLLIGLDLWRSGALGAFVEMVTRYLPLHNLLTGEHQTLVGVGARGRYLVRGLLGLGGLPGWLPAALGGLLVALKLAGLDRADRERVLLLAALALTYALYPVPAGKFWPYHWVPFLYFIILLAALTLVPVSRWRGATWRPLLPPALLALSLLLALRPTPYFRAQLGGAPPFMVEGERVDELTTFFQANLAPGDRVQPLDWTGGTVQALLRARGESATRFIYDYHFYHHISNPYIQQLRARFIAELRAAPPRYMVAVDTLKPWVSGPDTTREFPELTTLLDEGYRPVLRSEGYVVYERTENLP